MGLREGDCLNCRMTENTCDCGDNYLRFYEDPDRVHDCAKACISIPFKEEVPDLGKFLNIVANHIGDILEKPPSGLSQQQYANLDKDYNYIRHVLGVNEA